MQIYYSPVSRTVFIDQHAKKTELVLPKELDASEITSVLQSETLFAIITQLLGDEAK